MKTCTLEDCSREYYAKSFCKVHYMRYRRYGSPYVVLTPLRGEAHPSYKKITWHIALPIRKESRR